MTPTPQPLPPLTPLPPLDELHDEIDAALSGAPSPCLADETLAPVDAVLARYGFFYTYYSPAVAQDLSGHVVDVAEYRNVFGHEVSVSIALIGENPDTDTVLLVDVVKVTVSKTLTNLKEQR